MKLLIQAWLVHKYDNKYYLPYTHWIYLNEIKQWYDQITLIAPVKLDSLSRIEGMSSISDFNNLVVVELPGSTTYLGSIKFFPRYYQAYSKLPDFDVTYARYPMPFGWLQKVFFKKSKRIIHFVGDPMDAAKSNPNFNWFKRATLTTFFLPEHLMYIWACKGAKVYTNGYHLAQRLEKNNIIAIPLISSTLNNSDFFFDETKLISSSQPKLLYVGYLRKAKGVETIIKSFALVKKNIPGATLTIVGSGEFESQLKGLVKAESLKGVMFKGHVDNRTELNEIIRSHDIFCFCKFIRGFSKSDFRSDGKRIKCFIYSCGCIAISF